MTLAERDNTHLDSAESTISPILEVAKAIEKTGLSFLQLALSETTKALAAQQDSEKDKDTPGTAKGGQADKAEPPGVAKGEGKSTEAKGSGKGPGAEPGPQLISGKIGGAHFCLTSLGRVAASIANPLSAIVDGVTSLTSASAHLTQVSDKKWVSQDKKSTIELIPGFIKNQISVELSSLWDLYQKQTGKPAAPEVSKPKDTQTPAVCLEFTTGSIYQDSLSFLFPSEKQAAFGKQKDSTKSHDYINNNGEHVNVTVGPSFIEYVAEKDGKIITKAQVSENERSIQHKTETVTLNLKSQQLTLTGEQLRLIQQRGDQQIDFDNGQRLIRRGEEVQLLDSAGTLIESMTAHELRVTARISLYKTLQELQEARKKQEEAKQQNPVTRLLVAADQTAVAVLADGTTIEIKADKTAMIKTTTGQAFIVEASGRVLVLKDGVFVPVEGDSTALPSGISVRDGRLTVADVLVDLQKSLITLASDKKDEAASTVSLTPPAGGVEIITAKVRVTSTTTGTATIADVVGNSLGTWNFDNSTFDNAQVTVERDKTTIKSTNTIVHADNRTILDGGKGPELRPDGAMKLDDRTFISADGHVTSGSWEASAGFASKDQGSPAQQAAHAAMNIAALSIQKACAKALAGEVTRSDIGELQGSMSDLSACIALAATFGDGALLAQLYAMSGSVRSAIDLASSRVRE